MREAVKDQDLTDIYIGRQPIYDRKLDVVGYELLFRSNETNRADVTDGDLATSQVIVNSFMEIGLDRLVGSKSAFINLTRGFILGDYPLPFPKEKIVLEILEDIVVDDDIINAIRQFSKKGFTIALDDFVYHSGIEPLLEFADIIKIDTLSLDKNALQSHLNILRRYKAKLLAEKVETQEDFSFYKELGFDFFQGYFFCRPKILKDSRLPANRLSLLQLIAKFQDPTTDFSELEKIISHDVGLSYKLLRVINSAHYSLSKKVESLSQALIILGMQNIRNWASLIILADVNDKPHELIVVSMLRAKICELLAKSLNRKDINAFFTTGLFSTLDALMDRPLRELLTPLPLSDEINNALLHGTGILGEALNCAIAYEQGNWDEVGFSGLTQSEIKKVYVDALAWIKEVCSQLSME